MSTSIPESDAVSPINLVCQSTIGNETEGSGVRQLVRLGIVRVQAPRVGADAVPNIPSYPKTYLTMKTSPRQTLSGKVPENLSRVARRRTAGRRFCRTGFGPCPISRCNTRVDFPCAMFRLRQGFREDSWMTGQRLAVRELAE